MITFLEKLGMKGTYLNIVRIEYNQHKDII